MWESHTQHVMVTSKQTPPSAAPFLSGLGAAWGSALVNGKITALGGFTIMAHAGVFCQKSIIPTEKIEASKI